MPKYREMTNLEIYGAETLMNIVLKEDYDLPWDEGFFYCNESLCSESDANGYPIEIEYGTLSHLKILDNGILHCFVYLSEIDDFDIYELSNHGLRKVYE